MPQIHFVKNRPSLTVLPGANLMQALLQGGIPVASSCKGEGVCSKCRIQIVKGAENLSAPTVDEEFLKAKNQIGKDFRISCQTQVLGDVTLDTPYW